MELTHFTRVLVKAKKVEVELRRLSLWQESPLSPEKFNGMGQFGINTMTFSQWIQFVWIHGIYESAEEKSDFPSESNVASHALNILSSEELKPLLKLIAQLDDQINLIQGPDMADLRSGRSILASTNYLSVPREYYDLADALPNLDGEALEAQLQAFTTFFASADLVEKETIANLLFDASAKATPASKRLRIRKAAIAIWDNG